MRNVEIIDWFIHVLSELQFWGPDAISMKCTSCNICWYSDLKLHYFSVFLDHLIGNWLLGKSEEKRIWFQITFSLISVDKETKGKKRDSSLEPKHPLSTEHPTQMCHCCIIDDCTVVCALYKVICTLYCSMQTLYPRLHAVDSTFYTVAFWWRSKQRSVWSKKSGQQRVRRLRVWAASVWRTFHW